MGRSWTTWRKPTGAQGEHATHREAGLSFWTFLLWGDYCTTVPPLLKYDLRKHQAIQQSFFKWQQWTTSFILSLDVLLPVPREASWLGRWSITGQTFMSRVGDIEEINIETIIPLFSINLRLFKAHTLQVKIQTSDTQVWVHMHTHLDIYLYLLWCSKSTLICVIKSN